MGILKHSTVLPRNVDLNLAKASATDLQGLSRLQAKRLEALLASVHQPKHTDTSQPEPAARSLQVRQHLTRPRNRKRRNRLKHQSSQHVVRDKSPQQQESSSLDKTRPNQQCINVLDQTTEVCNTAEKSGKDNTAITDNIGTVAEDVPPRLTSGFPEVWADNRQELCEGLPYFRSYHSGIYLHDNVVLGYLLDGFGTTRDYVGSRVVISHTGGKAGVNLHGQHGLLSNQSYDDRSISALRNNMRHQIPLVLILGSKCAAAPRTIPHRYCVMSWFRITHIWVERESDGNSYHRFKVRFEKLTSEPGWWSVEAQSTTYPSESLCPLARILAIQSLTCKVCLQVSPLIYRTPLCLNTECMEFWHLEQQSCSDLILDEAFCQSYQGVTIKEPYSVKPPMLQSKDFFDGNDVSRIFWRGFCCRTCGKLNSRIVWKGWECSHCKTTACESRKIYRIAELRDPFRPVYTGAPVAFDWINPRSKICLNFAQAPTAEFRIARYSFGASCGCVYHIMANDFQNELADRLLHDYQTQDIDLRRRSLKTRLEGTTLSANFTHNAGKQYRWHAKMGTESFEDCATVITEALKLIASRVGSVLGQCEFNEVLSVAYFEGQKMDYHDDGEKGVGKTIASLSLGKTATMKFRPKKGKEDKFIEKVVLPESQTVPEVKTLEETTSTRTLDGPPSKTYGRDILRLKLEHGDVMIMHGDNFQHEIEHAVVPQGFRIAATARYISD